MLNGYRNENGIKINRSHQQKNKFARAAHFFSNLPLFCTTTMPFCTTKTSNFFVTHYFYERIVVCAYQRFCFLCSCSLLFFQCRSFLASISRFLTAAMKFSCFCSHEIRLLCFQSLALVLSLLST